MCLLILFVTGYDLTAPLDSALDDGSLGFDEFSFDKYFTSPNVNSGSQLPDVPLHGTQ
jgi:hypothetical protein